MATTQYIGARYVPLFADPIEWSNTKTYEPLTIVYHQGNSYTSRQYVPLGIDISNESFWVLTGNYNAQVEQYRRETAAAQTAADNAQTTADNAQTAADNAQTTADNNRAYTKESFTRVFGTTIEMQAATDLVAGMTCLTKGFYNISDGGQSVYSISDNGTPNGIDCLELANNLNANLVIMPQMNAAQFGIVPSETYTHTNFEYVINNFDCDLFVPAGRYIVDETINISKNGTCLTFDKDATLYCTNNTTTGGLLVVRNPQDNTGDENPIGVHNVIISGGNFYTEMSAENAIGVGIGCRNVTIRDCVVTYAGYKGITVQYAYDGIVIDNCIVNEATYGITVEGATASGIYIKPSAIVSNCVVGKFTNTGIAGLGCDKLIIDSCIVNNEDTMTLKTGAIIYITDTDYSVVTNNHLRGDTQGILYARSGTADITNNIIKAGDRGFNIATTDANISNCDVLESMVIGCIFRTDTNVIKSINLSNMHINTNAGSNAIWLIGPLKLSANNIFTDGGNTGIYSQSTETVTLFGGDFKASGNVFAGTQPTLAATLRNGSPFLVGFSS